MSIHHVYSLPPELLQTLTPRNYSTVDYQQPLKPPSSEPAAAPSSTSATTACNICLGATFVDVDQQRNHYRSDWHRYNVKNRLNGSQPVSEADFNQLVDALEDSLSGSESSSDEETDSDNVNALINKHKQRARSISPEAFTRNPPRTALSWFHSPPSTQIGVYRALFPYDTPEDDHLQSLKDMQVPVPSGRQWAMFMVAGGHFAGAIVRVSRTGQEEEVSSSKKPKRPAPDTEVLNHKTFHRYTTRRKQGGSQSLNDNAKGNAKSAGAQLRRYGEQALRDDIRNLLADWEEEINECELIFIRANGANRKIFMDYEKAPIVKGDERLRTFPFPTRRPTQSELARCLQELTRVKVSHFTEEALRAQDEAYLASLPKPKPVPTVVPIPEKPKIKPVKLTKEEEAFQEKWYRLLEMVSKGRLEPLKAFWEREADNIGGIDAQIPEWAGEKRVGTLLQLAALSGQEDVTSWLLEMHADPTVPAPRVTQEEEENEAREEFSKRHHQTAYDLAQSRGVRDVFRRSAGIYADWWDWFGAAHVPSALSREMEDERDEKKKARRKGLKDRVKEREAKEREKEKERPVVIEQLTPTEPAPSSGPRKLGGSAGDAAGIAGLTPEMRAKIERERRARAAEARLKQISK